MWVLVNVTDSARPVHAFAFASAAAEEGTVAISLVGDGAPDGPVHGVDELARRRHRRAHRPRLGTLVRRRRASSAT